MKIATTKAAVILGATLMIGSAQAQTTLIDNTTRNGSFEVFTGTGSPNALTPDVTDWTSWFSSDQGSYEGTPSHGLRSFFLDVGSGAINMTGHTIAVGDVITWGSKHTNTPNTKTGLVFDNGSSISWVSKPGSDATSTAVESVSGSYTVLVTDTDIIGSELGFGIENFGAWGTTDEVTLMVGSTTLIDNTTRNGSFEVYTGTESPNAILHPDVTDWTRWLGADAQGSCACYPTDGSRSFFLDAGSGAINMTGHTIAVGDLITWGSEHTYAPSTKTGLVFDNGSAISWFAKTGSDATSTAVESVSGSYTVLVTDTDIIGSELGFGIECSGQWGNTDEVFLSVTPVSTLPVPAITDIEVDAQTGEVTLTARVKPNTVHAFERSGDLTGWIEITDDVTTTTGEVELRYIPAAGVGRECYRLREF
jgi:hypothetical protein